MVLLSIIGALASTGCYQPEVDRDHLDDALEPPIDLFGDGGVRPPTDGRTPDASTSPDAGNTSCDLTSLSALSISVRTTALGGRYAPKNIGAIWIETAGGQYVKTVERWANRRRQYLTTFNTASGQNLTDAVSGATLTSHVTHNRTWNLAGLDGCEVPAGEYRVRVELTDRDSTGVAASFPFTKGTTAVVTHPADTAQFHDLTLDLH